MSTTLEAVNKLTRDLKKAATMLSKKEARYLVDAYYTIQDYRKASANQIRALSTSQEPCDVIQWLNSNTEVLENQIQRALDAWTEGQEIGRWMKSIVGIGPVISAGLLANIDIEKAPTAGHIWSFAGLNNQQWVGSEGALKLFREISATLDPDADLNEIAIVCGNHIGRKPENLIRMATQDIDGAPIPLTQKSLISALAKRPWNASLKTLCWKIGESFVKFCNHQNDVYGHLYTQRKQYELQRNTVNGYNLPAAQKALQKKIGHDTDAYKAYIEGTLPPAHIHARAKRWAVKLFLSHVQHVWYEIHYKTPPVKPYVIEHMGHVDMIVPPNWPMSS